ncbi:hypothetical protein ACDY96_30745 [Rhizobium mongolense]|uniref:hypothetical protein n=1 Tax=Rhizobium mongolense TaxID=57676 RepID=UPI003558C8AF
MCQKGKLSRDQARFLAALKPADNQISLDGIGNGAFISAWNHGRFDRNYAAFPPGHRDEVATHATARSLAGRPKNAVGSRRTPVRAGYFAIVGAWPNESAAQAPDIVTGLGTYLGYGAIGLGLGVAVLAAILLTANSEGALRAGTRFMMFGLALVVIGAGIELFKAQQASANAHRHFISSLNLPDEFWQDFLNARTQNLFGTAPPTDQAITGSLMEGEKRTFRIDVPAGSCRYYFVAAKPPAKTAVGVPATISHQPLRDKEYYQTGRLCVPPDEQAESVEILVEMKKGDSQFSATSYIAPPDDAWRTVAQQTEITRVVCTGQYERNCAGPHDIFMQCGAPPDAEIAQQVCVGLGRTTSRTLRLNTKGGNRCGYSLVQVTCS